jgi:exoribonuclease R
MYEMNTNHNHNISPEQHSIPGVLHYDRQVRKIGKKTVYECIPDDRSLPSADISVNDKAAFGKVVPNQYVLFDYIKPIKDQCTDKVPAMLKETIGPVTELENFYDYRIFCKDLFCSKRKFAARVVNQLKKSEFVPVGENRLNREVITIDSSETQDYDDAIGFHNGVVSIYISNVPDFMEKHDLWDQMRKSPVSTIYLPGKKRSMLPTVLSDNVLSLVEGKNRNVFCMDIDFNNDMKISFCNATICVTKNHQYESPLLRSNETYQNIFLAIQTLIGRYKYIKEVTNSLQVIEYLMIFMNHQSGLILHNKQMGIFRSLEMTIPIKESEQISTEIDPDQPAPNPILTMWKNANSSYTKATEDGSKHSILQLTNYVHITSPIRRLVDLLNMMVLQHTCTMNTYGDNALNCYGFWLEHIDKINKDTKSIKKVQNECFALHHCANSLEREFSACVLENLNNGMYIVFIENMKYIGKVYVEEDLQGGEYINVRLYVMCNESSFARKIRLERII